MKSNVSNHLQLAEDIYRDVTARCVADVSDERDLCTIRSRVKYEGISFLTITLPDFCKDFERSLEIGHIGSSMFRNFRKIGAIPAFLQGMLSQLFDKETGRYELRTPIEYSSSIVGSVRQICLAFKKLELECTSERIYNSIKGFVQTEHDFDAFTLDSEDYDRFDRISRLLWDNLFFTFSVNSILPHHGPGATAEGISGNGKFQWQYWNDRLEPYFPLIDSAYSCSAYRSEELDEVAILSEIEENPVRVTPVPKTLRSPRIIAIEPCCMQYAQQGIRDYLYDRLENYDLTAGHINFRDQSINQSKALSSSLDGSYATIDLSEASDRVPLELSLNMFKASPDLHDSILACRSTRAKLPDGTIIGPLKKFASMGSALCFPVESMYFYTICVMTLLSENNLPGTRSAALKVAENVFVYGDDIIVPSEHATAVLVALQKYNCKVNTTKTFVTGKFRESCGMDAFNGDEVTPVYVRKLSPENRHQADRIVSSVATANLFYKKGLWRTAQRIFKTVENIIGPLPYVSENSPALGRITFSQARSIGRWSERYQYFEVKAWVAEPVYRTGKLEGYAALQKSLSRLEGLSDLDEIRDELHLERYARHGVVALKRRWVPSL